MNDHELRYLELLSELYPSIADASAELINLTAILALPKGTEVFMSDIHGEYEAFAHLLKNGSGLIRRNIDDVFGDTLTDHEKRELASLVYYPREKMNLVLSHVHDQEAWFASMIGRLALLVKQASNMYMRSQIRKTLPAEFAFAIDELMTADSYAVDQGSRYHAIINTIYHIGRAREFVEVLCKLIQRISIDCLHVIGDVYDRGPAPDAIMDMLANYHCLDIQWGNHDIVWMGASLGQCACIAHVVRNCARYGNLSILEDSYGINILPLASFAMNVYRDDPCVAFGLKGKPDLDEEQIALNIKIQKAMAIIQFKVEGALIDEYPEFRLADRKLLDKINYERATVMLDGVEYELTDKVLPTVDPADPYRLTPEEETVMERLEQAFVGCERLQRHMQLFLKAGSLYKVSNGNLLFHASVPLNEDGSLMETTIFGETCSGKKLYDVLERYVRAAFFSKDEQERKRGRDLMWWLWLSPASPLFAKSKMATFEIYFIADKAARKEIKNPFYTLLDTPDAMKRIFEDFGLNPNSSRIICGHVPVKAKNGEDPIKCNGHVLTIDGGFSRAYQPTTGIAGYTLISNSHELVLATHEPFESASTAIEQGYDIRSSWRVVKHMEYCMHVADTDTGMHLQCKIKDLERLIEAYRQGIISERIQNKHRISLP